MMLYLFRHAKSHANTARLVTGTPADTLVDEGRRQAEAMQRWLDQVQLDADHFFTSTWRRAQETARLMFPRAEWRIDARLGETDAGSVAEWPLAQFVAQQPQFYRNNATPYPGGESHEALNRRVTNWLDELLAQQAADARIVVVAHSGPIACLIQHALGIGMERFPALLPAHASLTVIEYAHGGAHADANARKATLKGFSLTPAETAGPMLTPTRQ
ncbi:histidine phosphatase family protein [Paraburkholderia fynbosensis]|uniref:2,3-bisphosphoglycerate-dependent phosphoglycerate mutase n=1 Tax=Paraburkholderia fynbosensis TaxID=1200993 RepID=A0A6J5FM29_9BURK|nr:histidine phosphatase family protein [Paraburkholderia fynbosensis]CAB3782900.1 2,3-bisphosphoglycerate-dependent phosphoglycerate mutase [Paraburkholderia fynbosensis]